MAHMSTQGPKMVPEVGLGGGLVGGQVLVNPVLKDTRTTGTGDTLAWVWPGCTRRPQGQKTHLQIYS